MNQNYYNPFQNQYQIYNPEAVRQLQMEAMEEKRCIRRSGNVIGGAILGFLAVQFVFGLVIGFTGLRDQYLNDPLFSHSLYVFQSLLSVLLPFVVAGMFLKRNTRTFIPHDPVEKTDLFWYVCVGTGLCMVANVVTNFFITFLSMYGIELSGGSTMEPDGLLSSLMMMVSLAVIPAVCEEIAMRGIVMQSLLKHGKVFAILTTAVVFGILHGNLIQAPFAFMVGLVLGFITVKTNSIIPAVIIHFCNNGLSALASVIKLYAGDKVANGIYYMFFLAWVALGIIGLIILIRKLWGVKHSDSVLGDTKYTNPFALTTGKKIGTFVGTPTMVISIVFLVLLTAQTVHFS